MAASSPFMQAWLPPSARAPLDLDIRIESESSPMLKAGPRMSKLRHCESIGDSEAILPGERPSPRHRRRLGPYLIVLAALTVVPIVFLAASPGHRRSIQRAVEHQFGGHDATPGPASSVVWPASSFANLSLPLRSQEPAEHLLDNLLRDGNYLTSLSYGGQSNQVISLIHLLHLGRMTDKIVLVPSFVAPQHHIEDAPAVRASSLFDLDHFRRQTGLLMAEWADLKAISRDGKWDFFGCYALYHEMYPDQFSDPLMAYHHASEPTLWPMMTEARRKATGGLTRGYKGEGGYLFESMVTWMEDERVRTAAIEAEYAIRQANVTATRAMLAESPMSAALPPIEADPMLLKPDPRLMCFDSTFFIGSPEPRGPEIALDWGVRGWAVGREPLLEAGDDLSWVQTGRHLRFNQRIEDATSAALRQLFRLGSDADIPPFLAVHVRRGDFASTPGLGTADVKTYAEALATVRQRIDTVPLFEPDVPVPIHPSVPTRPGWTAFDRSSMRAADLRVLVATDEEDPAFLAELDLRGWTVIDHQRLRTMELYRNPWMPSFLDQAILSRAAGLVMTAHSTFSGLAGVRVRWWNGGQAEFAELSNRV